MNDVQIPAMAFVPNLNIPYSPDLVNLSIIDTTSYVQLPTSNFFTPEIAGYATVVAVCYSFLVRHINPASPSKYNTFVFDLGVRKDYLNSPPAILDTINALPPGAIRVEKDVATILEDDGVDLDEIGAIIWSHGHFDQ